MIQKKFWEIRISQEDVIKRILPFHFGVVLLMKDQPDQRKYPCAEMLTRQPLQHQSAGIYGLLSDHQLMLFHVQCWKWYFYWKWFSKSMIYSRMYVLILTCSLVVVLGHHVIVNALYCISKIQTQTCQQPFSHSLPFQLLQNIHISSRA